MSPDTTESSERCQPIQRRNRMSGVVARTALLDAAQGLFDEKVIDCVSVEEITRKAGLHKMAVYRLFGSRHGLLMEYVHSQCDAERRIWQDPVEGRPGDGRSQLLSIFSRLSEHARSYPSAIGRVQSLQVQFGRRSDAIGQLLECQSLRLRERLTKLCIGIEVREPDALSFALYSVWQGVAFSAWTGADVPSPGMLTTLVKRLLAAF